MTQARKSFAESLALAFSQMADRRFRGIVLRALALATLILAALGAAGVWLASQSGPLWGVETGWAAGAGAFLLWLIAAFVLLMPLAAFIMGLFLESVAEAVEQRHYQQDPPGREAGLWSSLGVSLRFMVKLIVLNALALFLYLVPVVNVAVFFLLNGYLAGREFFEMVALRHHRPRTVRLLRRKYRLQVLPAGVIIAALLAVPGVNLVAPLFGAALMVHVFKNIEARAAPGREAPETGVAAEAG
ncbi:MAG: EI24 domain-containing protein [Alphaproteobacteria bacterium]